ncbi:MAG: dihydropteroate synthase [Oscillospiraceae bacterium]
MSFFKGNNFSFDLGKKTYVMGILNITPDSFFDGGKWNSSDKAINHAIEMQNDGADIIDIGAQSTRPNHIELSEQDELEIIKKYINPISKAVNIPISIDTFYPQVAEYCILNGATIINDVSGIFNPKMAEIVKRYNAGWIFMHTGGGDATKVINYTDGVVKNVLDFFDDIENQAVEFGMSKEQLCFDMGIGFGKSNDDNIELIRNIKRLKSNNRGLLTALSCKRVIKNATLAEGSDLKYGTLAADTIAIMGGTDFIRVHHTKEAVLAAKMADVIIRNGAYNG